MTESSENPYAPPTIGSEVTVYVPTVMAGSHSLLPLWTWLTIAVLTAWFGTPADPLSMYFALAFGLVALGAGAILASTLLSDKDVART